MLPNHMELELVTPFELTNHPPHGGVWAAAFPSFWANPQAVG